MSTINICKYCGLNSVEKQIDYKTSEAICPRCKKRIPFKCYPLLLVGGPSAIGKTTILNTLTGTIPGVIMLDCDIIWYDTFQKNPASFFNTWLRVIKNIHQSDVRVVLFGAGFVVPENIIACPERRYFPSVYYLALTASDEVLESRLRSRPEWRKASDEAHIKAQLDYNRWIIRNGRLKGGADYTVLDISSASIEESARMVKTWIPNNTPSIM